MRLRLLDSVLLLLHDDATGRHLVSDRVWERLVMGVAIVELLVDGAARLERSSPTSAPVVRATGVRPTDPVLARLLSTVDGRDFAHATAGHDGFLPGMAGMGDDLLDDRLQRLATAGLLSSTERRVLGITVETVWMPGPRHDVELQLRRRLVAAATGQAPPDEEIVLLLAILHPTGSLPAILPEVDRSLLIHDVGALVQRTWLAQALFEITYVRSGHRSGWLYR